MRVWRGFIIFAILMSPPLAEAREKAKAPAAIKMASVQSSVIAAVGYSGRRHVLEVKLRDGRRYQYLKVPAQVARDFLASPSKGHFYNRSIKPLYRYELMP